MLTQLLYTGMLSTLQIQKGGYSGRIPHNEFKDRFRILDVNANDHVQLIHSIERSVHEHAPCQLGVNACAAVVG